MLNVVTGYPKHIKAGRYEVGNSVSILQVYRNLRNGKQAPVRLTIPVLRTNHDLAVFLGKNFQASAEDFEAALNDSALLAKYHKTPATALCLFVPNTYEIFWTSSPQSVLARMHQEYKSFWNKSRTNEAKELGLTPDEVTTVASIVEQETAYKPEKPMVAGMYLNSFESKYAFASRPHGEVCTGRFHFASHLA